MPFDPSKILPDYWMPRPPDEVGPDLQRDFDRLLRKAIDQGNAAWIDYRLAAPRWRFLCYVADHHRIALHGSGNPSIKVFKPRRPIDLSEFGSQEAVFAAADGIWAMFYAILDRDHYRMSLNNACIRLEDVAGQAGEPFYVFSISRTALAQKPWRSGVVYLLPPESFHVQPPLQFGEYQVLIPQLASPLPVVPMARLEVSPEDFPFLSQIRGHDDCRMAEYSAAMQTGAPWPQD